MRPDAGVRSDTHPIDNEHGGDACGAGGTMQEVGDEPNDSRARQPAVAVVEGFEGEAEPPLASPMSDIGYAGSRPPSREPAFSGVRFVRSRVSAP